MYDNTAIDDGKLMFNSHLLSVSDSSPIKIRRRITHTPGHPSAWSPTIAFGMATAQHPLTKIPFNQHRCRLIFYFLNLNEMQIFSVQFRSAIHSLSFQMARKYTGANVYRSHLSTNAFGCWLLKTDALSSFRLSLTRTANICTTNCIIFHINCVCAKKKTPVRGFLAVISMFCKVSSPTNEEYYCSFPSFLVC